MAQTVNSICLNKKREFNFEIGINIARIVQQALR